MCLSFILAMDMFCKFQLIVSNDMQQNVNTASYLPSDLLIVYRSNIISYQ